MKPPAFQFYADDFLGGTITFNNDQKGLYITMLCIQWSKGSVSLDEFESLSTAMAQPLAKRVLAKFELGQDGLYRNERMESERQKQSAYRINRSESGKAGAKSRWHSHSTAITQPMANDSSPSPSPSPIVLEREQHFPEAVDRPTKKEVLAVANREGLAEWKALDWLDEMNGCGWLDYSNRPIRDWQSILNRVKRKWESDGRPSSPPKGNHANNGKPHNNGVDRNAGTYNEGRDTSGLKSKIRGVARV